MATTRITAGDWRGRIIETPRGLGVRPTRSMVRESLFNILAGRIVEAHVLDLFAGAGTIGFEALSRGARAVTFVERDMANTRLIAATAARLGCGERCRIERSDVAAWLRRAAEHVATADVAYLDAPYRATDLDRVLELVAAHPPALVVCEHHEQRHLPERIGRLERVRETRHGLTTLTFLQRSTAPSTT